MAFERIAGLEHRGDSPLGPRGRAFVERALGEHRHLETLGEVERCRQSRRARTDDQDVAFVLGIVHARGSGWTAIARSKLTKLTVPRGFTASSPMEGYGSRGKIGNGCVSTCRYRGSRYH